MAHEHSLSTSADVGTSETTTGTGYGDLATVGPSITATLGGGAVLIIVSCKLKGDAAGTDVYAAVSGSAITPADSDAVQATGTAMRNGARGMVATGLSGGSHTFKMVYKTSAGTGTFQQRRIILIPLA